MNKKLILATFIPLLLIFGLFFLVRKSSIRTYNFERTHQPSKLGILQTVSNAGVYEIKVHNDRLYGTDLKAIYLVEFPSMKRRIVSELLTQPIIGWGFHYDTILAAIANTRTIYYINPKGKYEPYQKFTFAVKKIFIANDSIILLKASDTSFINDEFYSFNLNSKKIIKLIDNLQKFNDGGFATDGDFIDSKDKIIYFQFNMGRYSVIDKKDMIFLSNLSTIDHNESPPPVIHFASQGFRLDEKFSKTNITGFVKDSSLYLFSNAFSNEEYYHGAHRNEYPIDVYDLKTHAYKYSFQIPKNTISKGALMTVTLWGNRLFLIYSRKIIIGEI